MYKLWQNRKVDWNESDESENGEIVFVPAEW